MKAYCSYHQKWEDVKDFNEREDRPGYYRWCKRAMAVQGRSVKYPPENERGFGKVG